MAEIMSIYQLVDRQKIFINYIFNNNNNNLNKRVFSQWHYNCGTNKLGLNSVRRAMQLNVFCYTQTVHKLKEDFKTSFSSQVNIFTT